MYIIMFKHTEDYEDEYIKHMIDDNIGNIFLTNNTQNHTYDLGTAKLLSDSDIIKINEKDSIKLTTVKESDHLKMRTLVWSQEKWLGRR